METRNNEELMMGYLYDELTSDEKINFEERLAANPKLLLELNELKGTRKQIALKDEELVDPFMFSASGSGSVWMAARIIGTGILKPAMGLAASIALVILLGYFTDLSLSTKNGYLSLSFGKESSGMQDHYATKAQFDQLLSQMSTSKNQFTSRLTGIENNVDWRFTNLPTQPNKYEEISRISADNAKQLSSLALSLQTDNLNFLDKYMTQSNSNQQRLIEGMLIDFSNYLEDQREEDLRSIEFSLKTLKQNQEISTQETNQVLASIISKVNNQNN